MIRDGTKKDLKRFSQICSESFPHGHTKFSSKPIEEIVKYFMRYLDENLPKGGFLVYLDKDEIVGGICYRNKKYSDFRLNHLAVDLSHRRKGVGKKLIAAAEERIMDYVDKNNIKGAKISLRVLSDEFGLKEYYESIGYELQKASRHWYNQEQLVYVLEKII